MNVKTLLLLLVAGFFIGFHHPTRGDVKVASIFGDDMVLQRDVPIPIWGEAAPGEEVKVTFKNQVKTAKADEKGQWQVELEPVAADRGAELHVEGKNKVDFKNVAVGEVWIASGQSNMELRLRDVNGGPEAIESTNEPELRGIVVKKAVSPKPEKEIQGKWQVAKKGDIKEWSAAGFFFAKELHSEVGVPVGLIMTYWGGTPVEAWTPMEKFADDPAYKARINQDWEKKYKDYLQKVATYDERLKKYKEAVEKAKAEGKPPPARVRVPNNPYSQHPGQLYNAMISPLVPYALKGVIWYQGEQNAPRAFQYRKWFPNLITSWRELWKLGEFPFYFVQLPNYRKTSDEPSDSDWSEMREAQAMTLSLTNTAMAVAIDIGEADNIHPKNKKEVGHRLALLALANLYGKRPQGDSASPLFDSMEINGDHAKIVFKNATGLVARDTDSHGEKVADGKIVGFQIAGDDKQWFWADAKIEGDCVIVSSDKVPKPVAVRYAWGDNPRVNLYNATGLPAAPFRTDKWAGVTDKNH